MTTALENRRLFRNNTAGWIGAVQVGPTGAPEGVAIEPGGTVWLSEQECRLTAHAPRSAADNPFSEQTYEMRDPETGNVSQVKITPLTIVEDDRDIPNSDRFFPAEGGVQTVPERPSADLTPTPGAVPPLRADVFPSSMPEGASPGLTPPPPPVPPGVRAAVEAARVAEEHAAASTPEFEETGAAVPPAGEAPQGEYAAHEEVGTPDAPAATPPPFVPEGE